jgi:hypothetical protein
LKSQSLTILFNIDNVWDASVPPYRPIFSSPLLIEYGANHVPAIWAESQSVSAGQDYCTLQIPPLRLRLAIQALTIGASLNTAQTRYVGFFNGTLDDVRVYNRVLSATEIAALASMNSNSPLALAAAQPADAMLAAALPTPDAIALTITRMQASVKFNASHHDSCSVTGTIPDLPAAFNPVGQTLTLNIGGLANSFTLDAKDHAKSSQGSMALKLNPGAATAPFSVKLTHADCVGAWSLSPAFSKPSWQMDLWASIDLAGNEYSTPISVKYSSSKQQAKLTK